MVKPKIACYITGGWTECRAMTQFLEKINSNYDYRQRFPQKGVGKKGKTKRNFKITGATGTDLLNEVYHDMRNHTEEIKGFQAILIEDDMDDQYFLKGECVRDYARIENRKQEITNEIRKILSMPDMPVFFLYAMPEIESWFVADWDHTFGIEYYGKLINMNTYFSITFRNYVLKQVLTEKYPLEEIENYGYFDGVYKKLSDQLINAFHEYSCQDVSDKNNKLFNEKINGLIKNNKLMYSKKGEGINMLLNLNPDKVAEICGHYFAKTYHELREFHME